MDIVLSLFSLLVAWPQLPLWLVAAFFSLYVTWLRGEWERKLKVVRKPRVVATSISGINKYP